MRTIAERLTDIQAKVEQACAGSGRAAEEVTVLAATKTRTVPEIIEAVQAGITHLGENYIKELVAKREALQAAGYDAISWHAIGHLQRNKVRFVVPFCTLIHSVDSLRLAQEIDKRAAREGRVQPVLLEVNVSGEDSKFGIMPAEVAQLAEQVAEVDHLKLQGLMTMPPYSEDPETSRPHFRLLRGLAEELASSGLPAGARHHLSMGMSGDYQVAIEEGATIIRLGTVLFGPRAEQ